MNITDNRFKKQELFFDKLKTKEVYISHRLQRYVILTTNGLFIVCLETGELYDRNDCIGDVFEPVKATLVVE